MLDVDLQKLLATFAMIFGKFGRDFCSDTTLCSVHFEVESCNDSNLKNKFK